MDYFIVVDALETSTKAIKIENINADDTKTLVDDSVSAHANIVSLATKCASNKTKKTEGKVNVRNNNKKFNQKANKNIWCLNQKENADKNRLLTFLNLHECFDFTIWTISIAMCFFANCRALINYFNDWILISFWASIKIRAANQMFQYQNRAELLISEYSRKLNTIYLDNKASLSIAHKLDYKHASICL